MASTSGTFSVYPTYLSYRVTADEISSNPSTNTSVVRVKAFLDNSTTYAESSGGSGTTTPGNWSYGYILFNAPGSVEVYSTDITVGHNPDGTGSYSFSGTSSMNGWGSASTGTGTLTLTALNLAPGKRWNGTTWLDVVTAKRWNGSTWLDLTIKRRWNGSTWLDIS